MFEKNDLKQTGGFFAILGQLDELIANEQNILRGVEKEIRHEVRLFKRARKELKLRVHQSEQLMTRIYRGHSISILRKLENNIRLQATLAASLLVIFRISSFFGVSIGTLATIGWIYKAGFRWLPALSRKDISEAIADFI